ncbi:MAG: hypothetical protein A3G26_10940 [Betaproteobacteria bacterium RIFCSPLOWO2_12_FULL_65_110]|nr:MAG: hypothetical protein A3G26_10940 [Betaproteobacteria bacterium RIFCSPLOWO2_12_FULL_65_110]
MRAGLHKKMRVLPLLFLGLLVLVWTGLKEAQAQPAYQAAGTQQSGTGAVSPPWPAHAVGDVALLFVETTGGQAATLSTPAGFVEVTNSPQATGGGTNGTRITVFWARATSTSMPTPTVGDPGNHAYARILTYRGVVVTGDPWDVTGGGVKGTASTSVTVTGVTTTVPNTLILQAVARDNDSAAGAFSAQANANLASIAERSDAGTTSGNGGGIGIWDGVKATAGATGDTTATVTSSVNAFLTIALKPAVPTFLVEAAGGGAIGTQIAGTSFDLGITARNPDNSTNTGFTGTATISSSGQLSAGSGVTANFVAGVLASHTVRVWNTGTFDITAISGTTTGTSNSFVVAPKLQILVPGETAAPVAYPGPAGSGKTGTPTNQTAGTAFTVTINAVDEGWNVVTTATDTVSISSSDPAAVLPPAAALVSGTQTFSVVLNTPSSQTLTATITAPTRADTSSAVPLAAAVVGGGFNACDVGTACTNSTPPTYVHTKLAGTTFSLDLVALKTDGSRDTSYNSTVSVELLNSSDNSGTLDSDQCNSSWSPVLTLSPDPAFVPSDNGLITVGPFNVPNAYREARVRVTNVGGASRRSCSSDNFAIRPTAFSVTSTDATNTGTSGTPAIKTGANFNLTAASIVGYDGTPAIDNTKVVGTPNAGAIGGSFSAAPVLTGTASGNAFFYSEAGNVGLNAYAVYDSAFTIVDQPSGGCTADFSNSLVGGKYGCSFGSVAVAQSTGVSGFGRFVPDNFNVSYNTPSFATACGTFSYVGAPVLYSVAPVITVTARNGTSNGLTNATTTNYAGAYMKLANASLTPATQAARYSRFDALGGGATPALDTAGLPATAGDPVIGTFTNGVGTLTFGSGTGLVLTRSTTAPNAPFDADIALALNVIDTDLVAFAGNPASFGAATSGNGIAFNAGKPMRFGILKLDSAYGSELLPIRVPVRAMYWNGSGWQTNSADSCTGIPAGALVLGNYGGGLNGTNMGASHLPGSATTLSSGTATFTVTKPSPVALGSVDFAINLGATSGDANCIGAGMTATGANLPWLRGSWAAPANCSGAPAYGQDPNARLTFGSSRSPFIYLREMY